MAIFHSSCFLAIISLVMAVGFSGYILFCLIRKKFYTGRAPIRGTWAYRDKEPRLYWFYVALYSFWDAVAIYGFVTQLK